MSKPHGSQGNSWGAEPDVAGTGFEAVVPKPKLRLMDQVREVMRLRHYSIRTERCYCDWIRRYKQNHSCPKMIPFLTRHNLAFRVRSGRSSNDSRMRRWDRASDFVP